MLPKPLPSGGRCRPDRLAGVLLALVCAGIAMPAAADGNLLIAGATAPRSRLHVAIPGYTAYYVPAADAPPPAVAAATSSREPAPDAASGSAAATGGAERVPMLRKTAEDAPPIQEEARPFASGPLLAAAKAPVDDATAPLVLGYTPGTVGVPAAAESRLDALAERLRQDPTMTIALEGFAGGADSLKARRLALWRARAVRTRLIEDGIAEQRIRVRAAGAEAGVAATERVDVRIVQP